MITGVVSSSYGALRVATHLAQKLGCGDMPLRARPRAPVPAGAESPKRRCMGEFASASDLRFVTFSLSCNPEVPISSKPPALDLPFHYVLILQSCMPGHARGIHGIAIVRLSSALQYRR